MSVLLLFLCITGGALAMPQPQQGYNYQIIPAGSNDYPLEQYQLLQQQIEQHQQQTQQPRIIELPGNGDAGAGGALVVRNEDSTADLEAQLQQYIEEKQLLQLQQHQQQQQPQQQLQQQQLQQQQQEHQQQNTNLKTFVLEVPTQQEQQALEQQQQQLQQQPTQQQPQQQQPAEQLAIIEQQQQQSTQQRAPIEQYAQPPQQQQTLQQQPHPPQQQQPQQFQLPQIQVPQQQRQQSFAPSYQHQPTGSVQYNKEFYYLSAPQEDFEEPQNFNNQFDQLRRNVRVVFIRAPEQNGIANAALQLAKQSIEAQTAIYVLSKQHDAGDLANKLQQIRHGAQKPEVVFIKYRTPAEAEHAQRTIQAQYEALDGPNHFNHDGVAPTHNFVGSIGRGGGGSGSSAVGSGSGGIVGAVANVPTPDAKYLPAATAVKV